MRFIFRLMNLKNWMHPFGIPHPQCKDTQLNSVLELQQLWQTASRVSNNKKGNICAKTCTGLLCPSPVLYHPSLHAVSSNPFSCRCGSMLVTCRRPGLSCPVFSSRVYGAVTWQAKVQRHSFQPKWSHDLLFLDLKGETLLTENIRTFTWPLLNDPSVVFLHDCEC